MSMVSGLMVVMRGYDMAQVDRLLARAEQASASQDAGLRASACRELQTARFRDRLRGHSRPQVDRRIEQLVQELGTDSDLGPAD